jgi:uncharacterized protein YecE (DUF72 family)
MDIWLGTSGYSYSDWIGGFYPAGTRAGGMLGYYSRHFPLVELNFTFYRMPTAAMLQRLVAQTPRSFQFCVKMPRSLSHEQQGKDIAPFREAVSALRDQGRMLSLLCQFSQAFHHGRSQSAWVETLSAAFRGTPLAVEFRHRSWMRPGLAKWCEEQNIDLVAVDVPDLPGLFPRGWVQSSRNVYIRFHSRNANNWYQSDKDRYDYSFDDTELKEWIAAIQLHERQVDRVLLLFNNCHHSQAAANAKRMRELLAHLPTQMRVIEPSDEPAAGSRQLNLFEE